MSTPCRFTATPKWPNDPNLREYYILCFNCAVGMTGFYNIDVFADEDLNGKNSLFVDINKCEMCGRHLKI
jgi:hypothetical protein